MNKKVKWSIISISTASVLAFGGLVVQNNKATNSTQDPNNPTSSGISEDSNKPFSDGNSSEWDINQDENHSNWGHDELREAPSGGFDQGHGSSGASR